MVGWVDPEYHVWELMGAQRVLAVRLGVSTGAACGWLGIARHEGRGDLRAHDGGRCLLGGAYPEVLARLVAEQTDATLVS
jgi:hypothetical protein